MKLLKMSPLDIYYVTVTSLVFAFFYLIVLPKAVSVPNTGVNILSLFLAPLGIVVYAGHVCRFIKKSRARWEKERKEE
jgi:uncharacterized membrane protein